MVDEKANMKIDHEDRILLWNYKLRNRCRTLSAAIRHAIEEAEKNGNDAEA